MKDDEKQHNPRTKKYRKQHGIAKEQHKKKRSRRFVSILNRRGHESTNKKCGGKEEKNGKKEKEKMKKKKPSKLASRQAFLFNECMKKNRGRSWGRERTVSKNREVGGGSRT